MTIFLSEAMSKGIANPGVPTDPSRVKELLEEMYKLYDIDLLPFRKCILGVHLIAEFAEQAMLQDERELNLISSLCLWKTRTDACFQNHSKPLNIFLCRSSALADLKAHKCVYGLANQRATLHVLLSGICEKTPK